MISFVVGLTNQITAPARAAQSSMINLGGAVKKTQGELSLFQKQLTLAKSIGDIGAYRKYSAAVDESKRKLFGLNEAMRAQGPAVKAGKDWTASLTEGMKGLGGVLAGMTAIVAAGAAVVGTLVAITVAAGRLALEAVATRNRLLATFDALGEGWDSGRKTLAFLDTLSSKLPQTRAQLAEWTKSYMAMGMTDLGQLRGQLVATASAQAIMGDEGAEAFQTLTKRIQEAVATSTGLKIADKGLASLASTGANVADVAAEMGLSAQVLRNQLKAGTVDAAKFGDALNVALVKKGRGPLAEFAGDLPTQIAKARESFSKLLEGVNVKPFLGEVRGLFGILDQNKASGQAFTKGLTFGLNNAMVMGGNLARTLKHFALDVVIWGLKAYIALKPFIGALHAIDRWLEKLIPGSTKAGTAMSLKMASPIGPLLILKAVGTNVVQGLLNGITAGTKAVGEAAKGLGQSALDAVKNVLGIHSPSRVMLQFGAHTGAGLAQGIRSSTPTVHAASASMGVTAAIGVESGARRDTPASATGDGKRITIDVGGIHFHGGAGGKSALEITEEAVSLLFERLALAKGLG